MHRLWTCSAIVAVGTITLGSITVEAAESEARTLAVTRLERLKPSELLLKPPEGLRGGFVAARGASDVDFAVFPGQFSGARLWSSWGDVLAASDGRFYAAIGDHDAPHGTTFVYCVDPKEKTVTRVIDCNQIVPTPPDRYSPGKIHAPLVQADDGGIYVFGYRGSVRRTGSETGYRGDWLLRYRPATGHTESLGMPVPFSSVPVLEHCSSIGCLYGISVPGQTMPEPRTQLFRYDLKIGRVTFTCEVDAKGPRAIIVARDGRVYFGGGDSPGGEQRLMRYDPRSNRVTKLRIRIPGDGMLRAASRADADGIVYGISKDGIVFAFDTNTETVTEITKAFVAGRLYTAVCRLDPTDRYLYYIPGAHGRSSETGTPVIQLNVKTRRPEDNRNSVCALRCCYIFPKANEMAGRFSNGKRPMCRQLVLLAGVLLCAVVQAEEPPFVFEDVSKMTGIAAHLEGNDRCRAWRYAHGAGWGDVNGDGRPDLYVGAFAARPWYRGPDAPLPNTLLINGPRGFAPDDDETIRFAPRDARCSGVLFADLDNDGDLDLVVANHVLRPDNRGSRLFANDGKGQFRDVTPTDSCWPARRGVRNVSALDLNNDGLLDLLITDNTYGRRAQEGNRLYVLKNRGRFRFEDGSAEFGFPQGHTVGLGLAIGDVNEDGTADIFVAGSNRLFVSVGKGKYRESHPGRFAIPPADVQEGHHCGAAFGDLNGDGLLDLVTAEHGVPARLHLFVNEGVQRGEPDLAEKSRSAGIGDLFPRGTRAEPIKCAHVALIDMDNDGRRDIVLSVIYRDNHGRIQPVILRNLTLPRGKPKFSKPPYDRMVGYYAAAPTTDFDQDGRIDIFLASWFEHLPNYLFRNVSDTGNWLTVRIDGRGKKLNSMGIGAVVRVYAPGRLDEPEHLLGRHDIAIGTGYASGDEAIAHFGLGKTKQCDVEVRWGKDRLVRLDVVANQAVTVQFE